MQNKCFTDAEVINENGIKVPAGSTQIVYDQGTRSKWVASQEVEHLCALRCVQDLQRHCQENP